MRIPFSYPAWLPALLAALFTALFAVSCGGAPDPEDGASGEDADSPPPAEAVDGGSPAADTGPAAGVAVSVWFSRGEAPARVERRVEASTPEAALEALVAGPTAGERAAGLSSWFSDSTAGAVSSVDRRNGFLVVDFRGLDRVIPGAGSSAGSAQLLASLDSTVFQFPSVDSVEYRLDGSCGAFWEWLQRGCEVVRRR